MLVGGLTSLYFQTVFVSTPCFLVLSVVGLLCVPPSELFALNLLEFASFGNLPLFHMKGVRFVEIMVHLHCTP